MRAEILATERALDALAPEWEDLLARSATPEPVLSPTWLCAWWRVFGGGRALRVVAFREQGRLIGLAPLAARLFLHRRVLPFRRVELLGSGEDEADEICSEYLGVVAERGREDDVAAALADLVVDGRLGAVDELLFPAMSGDTRGPRALADAFAARGFDVDLAETSRAPHVPLPKTFDAWLSALPSEHRYLVRRSLRDFEAWSAGTTRVNVASTSAELAEGLRVLRALHGERWSEERADGAFASTRFRAFHEEVMPALLSRGALELSWITVRDAPIAALYNIVWNGKVHFYQGGRAVDVPAKIRPGIVAHAFAIRRAIERGLSEYDFLAGTARYKLQLATATRPLVALRVTRRSRRERVRLGVEEAIAVLRRARDAWNAAGRAPVGPTRRRA
ncbi:MAG: GNAT family N-acetyltransferase [Deltaproteobacteria bacterium]|nr:GNAT family N-acetyltransferase [Deltaproteobacteria bacterium]